MFRSFKKARQAIIHPRRSAAENTNGSDNDDFWGRPVATRRNRIAETTPPSEPRFTPPAPDWPFSPEDVSSSTAIPPERPATPPERPATPYPEEQRGDVVSNPHREQQQQQEQDDAQQSSEENPGLEEFAPKYVPFVDSTPLRTDMFATDTSHYGRVNPAIMGGFGGDDESIWLVDDEETDEEAAAAKDVDKEPDGGKEAGSETLEQDTRASTDGSSSQPVGPSAAVTTTSFRYQANPALLDDAWLQDAAPIDDTAPAGPPAAPSTSRLEYASIPASILAGFDPDENPSSPGQDQADLTSSISSTYVVLSDNSPPVAMTSADILHRVQQSGAGTGSDASASASTPDDLADDFRFGQRYQKAVDSSDVLVTHLRVLSQLGSGEHECVVCAEAKDAREFPQFAVTGLCNHAPTTCLECVQTSIRSDLDSKLWTEIGCPECSEVLDYIDIQRHADPRTFLRYETLALRAAMSEAENFFWCTSSCGSGQIHDSGSAQPIVTCLHCGHRSCFQHNVAWHESLTCGEYDQLLADPENFRSRLELEAEELEEAERAQLEADWTLAKGLLAEEEAEARRRQDREREERERAKRAALLARQIATRRKREEERSRATVEKTTKPCPGCGWAIEKNSGCAHMTCIKCRRQFCWYCFGRWQNRHSCPNQYPR